MLSTPELPEVEALVQFLDLRTRGRRVARVELTSISALRTVQPGIERLVGGEIVGWSRRGKFLCLDAGGIWLVVHLARDGWVKWYDRLPQTAGTLGRGPLALRLGLASGLGGAEVSGFDLTEIGTQKRLSLWVVEDPDQIESVARLGADPLDSAFDVAALARVLGGSEESLKSALTNQSVLSGIGNAYSDEVLHAARLSPFKLARSLSEPQLTALHASLVNLLGSAVAERLGLGAEELKQSKRRAFRVHGRTGAACPDCGDTIRQVAYTTRSLQYCPTCQTGGRPLADRRLSRLLK